MPRRQYRNPPIHEAVCEIRFAPGREWNLTVPAIFYDKVKDEYDGKPREQKLLSVEPNPKEEQKPGTAGMVALNEVTRVQFVSADNTKIIGLNADALAISMTRPYRGWDEVFRPSIERGINTYVEVAAPNAVRRIGLRYINQIFVSGGLQDLLACFANPPQLMPNAACRIENFASRHEYIFNDQPITIAVTLARIIAPEGQSGALLDIDLVQQWPAEPLPIEQTMSRVDDLRTRERNAFESLITDRAREIFDA